MPPSEQWDKPLPGETKKAFDAFCAYRDLKGERDRDLAYCIFTRMPAGTKKAPGQWTKWCQEFLWDVRSKAYDRDTAIEESIENSKADIRLKRQRKRRLLSDMWEMHLLLMDRAKQMLSFPLQEITRIESEDGKKVTIIIKPIKWTAGNAIQTLELAIKLGSQVAGLVDIKELDAIQVLTDSGILPDNLVAIAQEQFGSINEELQKAFVKEIVFSSQKQDEEEDEE